MLKYSLSENQLTERPDDFSATTHPASHYDMEAIINRMLNKGTAVTYADTLAVMRVFQETLAEIAKEGGTVNTPLFNTSFSISGVFESATDSFDGNRHKLNINISKGILLRSVEKDVKFEKINAVTPTPQILEVRDIVSGSFNEKLTSGGVVELIGSQLKIEGEDPACGLWFVPETGEDIKATFFIDNKPARITAIIPQLQPGNYQIKIVTQFSSGGVLLKTPKVNISSKKFLVE